MITIWACRLALGSSRLRTKADPVPQYWDSITKEDLEFSVGTKANNWEVKELLADEDRRQTLYHDAPSDYASSMYHQSTRRNSNHGGFAY